MPEIEAILVGGQAVAFWSRHYLNRPLTSQDIDFLASLEGLNSIDIRKTAIELHIGEKPFESCIRFCVSKAGGLINGFLYRFFSRFPSGFNR